MAGYSGLSMSNNALAAYAEGKKPVSRINKADIQKYDVNTSITFFRWFVKNYCGDCGWHHTSYLFNKTSFYDIERCSNRYKEVDIEKLKSIYRKEQAKRKPETRIEEDKPYYAKVEYSIRTYSGGRKYIEVYAIVYGYWAHFYDEYYKKFSKKRISGSHFIIEEKFESRPEEMPEDVAEAILEIINKQ